MPEREGDAVSERKISGVKCSKCGAEVSHVVTDNSQMEAMMRAQETNAAIEHRKTCDGEVRRFARE